MGNKIFLLLTAGMAFFFPVSTIAQPFIHPGIDQASKDLAYMKKMVLAGQQPWKAKNKSGSCLTEQK